MSVGNVCDDSVDSLDQVPRRPAGTDTAEHLNGMISGKVSKHVIRKFCKQANNCEHTMN